MTTTHITVQCDKSKPFVSTITNVCKYCSLVLVAAILLVCILHAESLLNLYKPSFKQEVANKQMKPITLYNNISIKSPNSTIVLNSNNSSKNSSRNYSCYISQYGRDGIGHQLEGALSCVAVATYYANLNINYLSVRQLFAHRRRFRTTAAHNINQKKAKQIITLVENCIHFNTNIKKRRYKFKKLDLQDDMKCEMNTIYRTDNCWKWTRTNASLYYTNEFLNIIRNAYETLPCFIDYDTIFNMKKQNKTKMYDINVVIHIRLGDIGHVRRLNANYYYNLVNIINNLTKLHNKNAYFWIHTDGEKTSKYVSIYQNIENIKIFDRSNLEIDVFYALNQMILADIFVMSRSSLSYFAGLLNKNVVIHTNDTNGLNHWIKNNIDPKLSHFTKKELNISLLAF